MNNLAVNTEKELQSLIEEIVALLEVRDVTPDHGFHVFVNISKAFDTEKTTHTGVLMGESKSISRGISSTLKENPNLRDGVMSYLALDKVSNVILSKIKKDLGINDD
ncbi:hypothetical protein CMU19_04275 [Elizabethkingia anophelis]|nr:hypothetical protein [Elizabethkingia anophelis]